MNVSTKTSSSATAHKPMLAFWQQQTLEFSEGFVLKSPAPKNTPTGRRSLTIPFGKDASEQIARRCGHNPQALYICFLTTFAMVLRKYEDTSRVTIHSPLYGTEPVDRSTIQETVPIGLVLNDELSLRAHLRANQETIKQLIACQQFPLSTLRQGAGDALSSNVLFGTKNLHHTVSPAGRAAYDFVVDMWVCNDGVVINYEVNTHLFSDDYVRAFHRHWTTLLSYMEHPETALRAMSLLDAAEYETVVNTFNRSVFDTPLDPAMATIPALFEEQARQTPDAPAVFYEGQRLTYRQLNEAATQLAHTLQNDYQIGPEDRVGVMLDRSEWLIVSILGILKAGAAYVPIDASYPLDRKQYILDDASPKLLLTQSDYMFEVPFYTGQLLAIDIQFSVQANKLPVLLSAPAPSNLAYLIYTSGSTGRPKGVAVEHRSVANTLVWRRHFGGFGPDDVALQLMSYTFDGSVLDIFTTLTSGGSIVMLANSQRNDPAYLMAKINQHGVTNLLTVPSQYNAFLQEFPTNMARLRFVSVAGEATTDSLLKLHYDTAPTVALFNEYGPTENAVCSTACRLLPGGPLTIGKPVTNTQVFIVDAHQKPLPVGVVGEIAVAGVGLARGYWNQPALTASRFVTNPADSALPSRMYLTGDLGCWTPEGTILFRGRKDHQVKVRGFRIELGEIENVLTRAHDVSEAVVQDRQDATGATYLAAYVTSPSPAFDTQALTAFLREQLPDYMVPQYITILAKLPLTLTGKIDRKALPDPVAYEANACLAPSTPMEHLLVEVWEGVLGKSPVSVDANFFAEGGDSIKAIQVAARVHKAGYQLEVKEIFKHLVLRDLAALLVSQQPTAEASHAPAQPLTPAQRRWVGNTGSDPVNPYRTAVLRRQERMEVADVSRVMQQLQQQYDALRIVFDGDSDNMVQRVTPGESIVRVQEHTIPASSFSCELYHDYLADLLDNERMGQPLWQTSVFHLAGQEYLCLSVHRAVADHDAWARLLTDFVRGINAEAISAQPQVPYLAWVERVNAFGRSEDSRHETTFWKQQVGRADAAGQPPTEHPPGPHPYVRFRMGKDIVDDLLVRANHAFNTHTGHLVLTAVKITMFDVFNADQYLVGLDLSAREAFAGSPPCSPVGNYTAHFPLRLTFDGNRNLPYHLKTTKEQVSQVPSRGIGFGLLTPSLAESDGYGRPLLGVTYVPPVTLPVSDLVLDETLADEFDSTSFRTDYPLHVVARLVNHRLTVTVHYEPGVYSIDTIQTFRNRLEYNLLKLIVLCATQEHQELTPSDYGNQNMSLDDLEHINALYE